MNEKRLKKVAELTLTIEKAWLALDKLKNEEEAELEKQPKRFKKSKAGIAIQEEIQHLEEALMGFDNIFMELASIVPPRIMKKLELNMKLQTKKKELKGL